MDAENIDYKEVPQQHLGEDFLQDFNRFQETHRVWFLDGDVIHLKDDHFIENWDEKKKESVIQSLRLCLMNGGIVIGVFRERTLIGFASIEGEFFGRKKQYLELSYIHVSMCLMISGTAELARGCLKNAAKRRNRREPRSFILRRILRKKLSSFTVPQAAYWRKKSMKRFIRRSHSIRNWNADCERFLIFNGI